MAKTAGVSVARCRSAIEFFKENGVLTDREDTLVFAKVIDEFEDRVSSGVRIEERSVDVARTIRDENLSDLITKVGDMMKRPSLSNNEIKCVSAIYTELGLSEEYILNLLAYMKDKSKSRLTPKALYDRAYRLSSSGINTIEELEIYISKHMNKRPCDYEFARIFGFDSTRPFGTKEQEHFRRWSEEFGYSVNIVSIAYDITVDTIHKASTEYADSILEHWHKAGCKTVSDVEKLLSDEAEERRNKKNSKTSKKEDDSPLVKYTSFTMDDAIKAALARSYGEGEEGK